MINRRGFFGSLLALVAARIVKPAVRDPQLGISKRFIEHYDSAVDASPDWYEAQWPPIYRIGDTVRVRLPQRFR